MEELLAAIAKLVAHGNSDEVVTLLETKAPGIRQKIFQKGFDIAHGQESGKVTAAQAKVTELEGKVSTITAERDAARQANPDVAKIHAEWQKKLDDQGAAHATALAESNGKVKTKARSVGKAELITKLRKLGVRQAMAEVEAERHQDRMVPDDAGELQWLQPGLTIPFAASGDKTGADLLAEAIRAKVPADMIEAGGDRGSGDHGAQGNSAAGSLAALVEKDRKDATDRRALRTAGAGSAGVPDSIKHLAVG